MNLSQESLYIYERAKFVLYARVVTWLRADVESLIDALRWCVPLWRCRRVELSERRKQVQAAEEGLDFKSERGTIMALFKRFHQWWVQFLKPMDFSGSTVISAQISINQLHENDKRWMSNKLG